MNIIKQEILKLAREKNRISTSDLVNQTKLSRQYISRLLSELVKANKLVKSGEYRYTIYALPEKVSFLGKRVKKRFLNENLSESDILKEITDQAPFIYSGADNAGSIFDYAFSEMLNNAIEHSESKYIEIEVNTIDDKIAFQVRDFGIGVFNKVMKQRELPSLMDAAAELSKGKITTAPKAHSGEGIFFTSKIADLFLLESENLRLRIDNEINDIFIEEISPKKTGTKVSFEINKHTKKHLTDIFAAYQTNPGEYAFDKTEIKIRLFMMGGIYISRSQARRVLAGLEKFKKVILDFDRVPTVGQAFADEVFRVFKIKRPEIEIEPINMNKTIEFMIGRVGKPDQPL